MKDPTAAFLRSLEACAQLFGAFIDLVRDVSRDLAADLLLQGSGGHEAFRGIFRQALADVVSPCTLYLARQAVDFAVAVDDRIGHALASCQMVAGLLQGGDKTLSGGGFPPDLRDHAHALFLGNSGTFLLVFFVKGYAPGRVFDGGAFPHIGGQGQTVILGKLPCDGLQ